MDNLQLRYRIKAPPVKGMAAQNPFNGEKRTSKSAVFLYRLKSIGGTTGIVTAAWP
jgi:hypothetical protein